MGDYTRDWRRLQAVALVGLLILSLAPAANAEGCYAVVVGRQASADGFVIMAHNEDDGPPQIVNHRKVPRMNHPPGANVRLINGGKLDQVEQTWSYLWSEMPGMLFSDSYLNEWGVCIASDACRSREDKPELTDGGISYLLRRLVAERARSSREGVHIAAALVERFGYDGSGRTYIICDPDEGWLFCVVNGKHWLASRVPDDQVACVANTYSVRQVNLSDTMDCLASDNIVEYAKQRGWYDPDVDGPFNFAATYADPETASDIRNYARQWSGLRRIASDPVELSAHLPTTVTPKRKMDVAMVMEILRDHYEGTELDVVDSATGNPHDAGVWTICNSSTQTSFVAQLRRDMPPEVGFCWWICLGSPCQSVYIPFHFGVADFPKAYAGESQTPSETFYNMMLEDPTRVKNPEAFWLFKSVGYGLTDRYRAAGVREAAFETGQLLCSKQPGAESRVLAMISAGEKVGEKLRWFSDAGYRIAIENVMAAAVATDNNGFTAVEKKVVAVHLRNLIYMTRGDTAQLRKAVSDRCIDIGGGSPVLPMKRNGGDEFVSQGPSVLKWAAAFGQEIDALVDTSTSKIRVRSYDRLAASHYAKKAEQAGLVFEPGDVLVHFPSARNGRTPDGFMAVYRKENGEWKIIALD